MRINPVRGMILAIVGGPDVVISRVRALIDAPPGLGVQPVTLELFGCKEPGANLEAALESGWERLEAPAPQSPVAPPQRIG